MSDKGLARQGLATVIALALAMVTVGVSSSRRAPADTVTLKNGIIYRGTIDRDNTILWVYDGLKRVVLRDSKVARIESDASFRTLETFRVEQPLVKHGGAMPDTVTRVDAEPWNDRGRRIFSYEGTRIGRPIRMEQAINELGPHLVKVRGVDGFWQGQLATSQVPREVVLAILAKVQRDDKNERIRVARFLIQAAWYAEARAELDQIARDFPDDPELRERVTAARTSVVQLEADQKFGQVEGRRSVGQPQTAATILRSIPVKEVSPELATRIQDLERADQTQAAADTRLASDLREAVERLPSAACAPWERPLLEILDALKQAPDTIRDRLEAFRKARLEESRKPEQIAALAFSGYLVGVDAAIDDLEEAASCQKLRDAVSQYLRATDSSARAELLATIDSTSLAADAGTPVPVKKLETITRLARLMPPPLHEVEPRGKSEGPRLHRVRDDDNETPTEYLVSLPPEYHPLRSYPAIVALHDGSGPQAAITWWAKEASRRGYVVVAPEYRLPEQGKDHRYSPSEHAAVELALRDARRRYSLDSDRVFLGGQLQGANMAWDLGLAHPDLFAGVVIVSGLPFKYVNRYLTHAQRLPLYVVLGDLAPAGNEIVFGQMLKPLIAKAYDVTYLEYLKRGLEDFPEEAAAAVEWMDRRKRDPYPKAFEALTARTCDNRYFGVVVREFQQGRAMAPAAVEPFGKNLNPASIKLTSSNLSNLVTLQTTGLRKLDIWLAPNLIDFRRRLEVRINGKTYFKGFAKPDLESVLEDLRLRGDRRQIYWMKVSAG